MERKTAKRIVVFVHESTNDAFDRMLEKKKAHNALLTKSALLREILQQALEVEGATHAASN